MFTFVAKYKKEVESIRDSRSIHGFSISQPRNNLMGILQDRLAKYTLPQEYKAKGVYPYFRAIEGKQGTEVEMGGHHVLMFGSNAYTGLPGDERIIQAGIKAMENMVQDVQVHVS